VVGAIDDVPAASLLLPYFAVDLDNPQALTTLFSINNASAAPAIAHVTLWTDLSVPTLDFNVYLSGYDVVTFNLRDLFANGVTPSTSHEDTTISPVGVFSLTTNPVSGVGPGSVSCDGQLPLPPLPASLLNHIQLSHTGQPSPVFGGDCSGVDMGDNIARGYITIDNVNFCTLDFPGDAGYFITGGAGAANNINQLWGDYFYVDVSNAFAQGETLVHLEADDTLGTANYTYYYRYSSGADQREGLSSTWATRFANGGAFSGGTDLVVWRDAQQTVGPFTCGTIPSPYPLAQNQIVIFDEEENPDVPATTPFSPALPGTSLVPFPWEANRTEVGGAAFPVPFNFGWLYLNLNTTIMGSVVPYNPIVQNYVTTIMDADGLFSVGYDGIHLDNVTFPAMAMDVLLPVCDGDPDPAACS
jgi:hypothetical protein